MSTQPQTIAFHTLGCKLNFSETATLSRSFAERGYQAVDFKDQADVYVINTCSVTNHADRECRKIVRQVRRRAPAARIAVVGCYAQLKPEEIAAIDGVNLVLGTTEKFQILEYLQKLNGQKTVQIHRKKIEENREFVTSFSTDERTRSFLKVQDGCDYSCSFCTIPRARGVSRNQSVDETMAMARRVAETETREIVLTGVNIGDFGQNAGETLFDLMQALDKLENIDRIRISSLEPNLLTNDMIDFVAQSRLFVPHFHLPLQAGSHRILGLMQRRYRRDLYADRVATIQSVMPEACIGVDVIVGFPTETDDDFAETKRFLGDLDVTYLHVFSYSERDHTPARSLTPKVPPDIRANRSRQLREMSRRKRRLYNEQFIGKTLTVLVETVRDDVVIGHTENYIRVQFPGDAALVNRIVDVTLTENVPGYVVGRRVSK